AVLTNHLVKLPDLVPGSLYHYRVKSSDASGNLAVSGDFSFTTAGPRSIGGGQPVNWTDLVKATLTGSTLQKTSGCEGCESTAVSRQIIWSGNAYLEIPILETGKNGRIGLMRSGRLVSTNNIDYSISLCSEGGLAIRERGIYRAEASCAPGDLFRIAVEAGVVKYYKNGAVIYQSRAAAAQPLVAAVTLTSLNASVTNVMIAKQRRAINRR